MTLIHYEEEVREAEDSGYEFPRSTLDQLQNALDALTQHDFEQREKIVEWEGELEVDF